MRVGLCADAHVGNHKKHGGEAAAGINRRCRLALNTLHEAGVVALRERCDRIVHAGDLLDTHWPEPQVLAAARATMAQTPLPWDLVLGNHEQVSTAYGDHALGPLHHPDRLAPVRVFEQPSYLAQTPRAEVYAVPFRPGPAKVWLPKVLEGLTPSKVPPRARLLVLHLGIIDESTPPWLRDSNDAIDLEQLADLCERYGFGAVASGNWHNRKVWGRGRRIGHPMTILQVGTLCPTGWDNPGLEDYGTLAIWDSDSLTDAFTIFEIPGPRFVDVNFGEEPPEVREGTALFVRMLAAPEDVPAAILELETWRDIGTVFDGDVPPPDTETEAREAARAAANSSTVEQAVAEFVGAMPLKDETIRPDVLQSVQGFLT